MNLENAKAWLSAIRCLTSVKNKVKTARAYSIGRTLLKINEVIVKLTDRRYL